MSKENQTFENENISVQLTCEPNCKKTFSIKVSPQGTDSAYKKAIKEVGKEVTLPGFRKGHAPAKMILSRLGSHVETEWKNLVLNTAYREAITLTNTLPLSKDHKPDVKLEDCSREEGATVTISFESFPDLSDVDFSTLSFKESKQNEVTDEQIEKRIFEIRHIFADWDTISDRPIQEGDYVDLDVEMKKEGEEEFHSVAKDMRFEVAPKKMGQWMLDLVVGASVENSVEGMSRLDEDSEVDEKEFIPTEHRLTIKKISVPTLPEIDDKEFLEKLKLEDVEAFKEKVREDVQHQEKMRCHQEELKAIKDQLKESFQFDLPATLVDRQLQVHLEGKEASDEELEKAKKETSDSLRFLFLIQKLTDEKQISISKEELIAEYQRQLTSVPPEESLINYSNKPDEILSVLQNSLMEQKAMDTLHQMLKEQEKGESEKAEA